MLKDRLEDVRRARERLEATIPTTLQAEVRTNPFLRADTPAVRASLDMDDGSEDWEVLAALRASKDAAAGWLAVAIMYVYPLADYFGLA